MYLPRNNDIHRLKCDVHTGTHSSTETKTTKTIVEEPGVIRLQESFGSELLAFGENGWVFHDFADAKYISQWTVFFVMYENLRGVGINRSVFRN